MKLALHRFSLQPHRTLGRLYVDGVFECYTLEDAVRDVKVYGETAIPEGCYRLSLRHSPKFGPETLWLLDVSGFEYIYIHAGNTERDTLGCILVGQTLADLDGKPGPDAVGRSKLALDALKARIVPRLRGGEECWIEIQSALRGREFPRASPSYVASPDGGFLLGEDALLDESAGQEPE